MREKRKRPVLSADQKIEVLQAGLRGDRTVRDVCREYEVAETDFYRWRDQLLDGGRNALIEEEPQAGAARRR